MSLMRRRVAVMVATACLSLLPSEVGSVEVPGSCVPNASRLVAPGCPNALQGQVRDVIHPGTTLPNLRPAVPFTEVGYFYVTDENGTPVLGPSMVRFTVSVRNVGDYALDLLGDVSTDLTSTTVQQCTSWTEKVCRERTQVGGFAWHPEHNHFHFQDFATYELRRLDGAGHIDRTDTGLLQVAPKVSFCLMDYEPDAPDAPPAFYVQCLGVNQGISAGWADVYSNYLVGQGLSIEGLPDGFYGIVVRLDPSNRLHETDDTDNETAVVFELYDNGQQARLIGPAT